jgi:hypothetical protein
MAIAKKKTVTSRRKPGAPKRTKAKAKVSGVSGDKIKIAGASFSKSSCHTSKSAAKSRAESVRSGGNKARVIKSGSAFCVYTGGKSKALSRRKRA